MHTSYRHTVRGMNEKLRHELKYICTDTELRLIEQRIRPILKPDSHADENGEYLIRSVYFDDLERTCFYENQNGIDPRAKFRIRVYNCSKERISLEKKKKNRGMTGKTSCALNYDTCMKMLRGESIRDHLGAHPLLDEWILCSESKLLRPVMLGEYVRKPYIYRLGNVRVTFDKHISASANCTELFAHDIARISVLPTGYHVLEVKYDDFLPDVIYQSMDCYGHFRQSTFSKFFLGCKALEGRLSNDI